jgi:hypothetical protein
MKHLLTLLLATLCAASGYAQTIKSLGYNTTNGEVVANTGTNTLTFTNDGVKFQSNGIVVGNVAARFSQSGGGAAIGWQGSGQRITFASGIGMRLEEAGLGIAFGTNNTNGAAITRTNLGLGATWLTNTNVTNFRTQIGLGKSNAAEFTAIAIPGLSILSDEWSNTNITDLFINGTSDNLFFEAVGQVSIAAGTYLSLVSSSTIGIGAPLEFDGAVAVHGTRTNLGLGSNNIVTFAGLTNNGDITINQTATNNGLLYIRRTNNEPFLGLANLIASNNTTISNETLFRVGTAEATNRSAQFGFRSTNTNGSGVAVFSVFGYNALAMIGPSARSATNTNGIEADIYSINPTNKVATLIDTNTGATLMHRPVGFTTNASTPSSTNTIVGWIQLFVGTNSVRVPYYQ